MRRRQKVVVFLGTGLLAAQMLFPPFNSLTDDGEYLVGYYFLPSYAQHEKKRMSNHSNVDAGLLLAQMLGSVLITGGLVVLLTPSSKVSRKKAEDPVADQGDGRGQQPADEFYDIGDGGDR